MIDSKTKLSSWRYREPEQFKSTRELELYAEQCRSEIKDVHRQVRRLESKIRQLGREAISVTRRSQLRATLAARFKRLRLAQQALSRAVNTTIFDD